MNKSLQVGLGAFLVLFGVIFTLQGLDILGGSGMSGKTLWAIIGPILAIIGATLVARGLRARD